ncbi:polysaccharide pyruvyl transferase family protein [Microbacterium sp. T32]|uniref:polysaccharide pyruvyl transferase family protein n=1 Tax=Microbacterium sp. T32 TaxID=1776083 RepID=UPI0018D3F004|nr:polysaccharide pyruvyl transferase family protein [Microbacterium sp. T32]
MRSPEVFVAAHGQDDNVGDPALRRAMLEGLAPSSVRHVLVGAASDAYVNALGLRDTDILYRSRREWQATAFRRAVRGRAAFVSNAGEIQLNRRRRRINRVDRVLIALIRLTGGVAISTGLGVRQPNGKHSPMLTSLIRACQIATWRDEPSRAYARAGVVRPDWAFALGSATSELSNEDRPYLLVSMRGDTSSPASAWTDAVTAIARELGLQVRVVSQVERDEDRGEELARRLDAELHPWQGGDHFTAETDLRGRYRQARMVVSDRLHVLIFAATEGAVPLYLPNVASAKIPRTMAVVDLDGFQADATDVESAVATAVSLSSRQKDVLERVDAARAELAELSRSMNALLDPRVTSGEARDVD